MPVVTSTIGHKCPCSQGEHLKNKKKYFVLPIVGLAIASLAVAGTPVSAKKAAPQSAKKATCPAKIDTTLDKTAGKNAGAVEQQLACGEAKPLKAAGEPILIGMMNPEGNPAGNFPEYTVAAKAAVDYINNELGGIGGNTAKGIAGRPLQLEVCKFGFVTPAENIGCATQLAAKKPLAVFSSLNALGIHFDILTKAGIPVIVGTPITAADFTKAGVFAIGGGGGCLGVHTGLVHFATQELMKGKGVKKPAVLGIPWANTPPGVFCFKDLEEKPVNVLNGTVTKSDSKLKGKMPKLTSVGVPIIPGSTSVDADATKVLEAKPDAIIYSAQGADCWTFVRSLIKLKWNPAKTPTALSGACIDLTTMKKLGKKIDGIYTVGAASILDPKSLKGQMRREAELYAAKMAKYATDQTATGKGFGTQGFLGIMNIWEQMNLAGGASATGANVVTQFGKTKNNHAFAGTPMSCTKGLAPYVAVCNATVSASRWDAKTKELKEVKADFNGLDLVAGTDLILK